MSRRYFAACPKIGLVGWNTLTGIGQQNRELVEHLPIDRWLVPEHPEYGFLEPVDRLRHRTTMVSTEPTETEIERWKCGLDWILFIETPVRRQLVKVAKKRGIRVVTVCNWEWTSLTSSSWLCDVDVLICPTRYTFALMDRWKRRFGFAWKLVHLAWPINTLRFQFQLRRHCRQFVFINGTGGCRGLRIDGSITPYRRKGIELMFEAARRVPDIPIIAFSQRDDIPPHPANVELRPPPNDNRQLYSSGDVCIQPSHWEGLGLQILECQAAGMPVITTDAPPR